MHLDWWTIGLQTINFAILVWLLQRFLYKPVLQVIDARKAQVRAQFDAATAVADKAKAQLATVEAERSGIDAERAATLKAATAQAQELAAARHAQAERDAQALVDATRKSLATEREQVLDEARRLAVDLGSDFARRLLAEVPVEYRAQAWIERIEQHLDALPQDERQALARQLADGNPLIVVTACALPATTAAQWKDRLCRVLGIASDITFNVDPELIAGAELHFPMAILRFSWQSALATARSAVGGHAQPG